MPGFVRAVLRLTLMAVVTAGALVAATAFGLPMAVVLGLGILAAGVVGMVGLSHRRAMVAVPMADPLVAASAASSAPSAASAASAASGAAASGAAAASVPVRDPDAQAEQDPLVA